MKPPKFLQNLTPKTVLLMIGIGALVSALLAVGFLWPRKPKSAGTVRVDIKGAAFVLDRLESAAARGYGLRGVEDLAPDRGALFLDPARRKGQVATFVMDGCLIPLDLIFLDQAGRVQRIQTAQPGSQEAFTVAGPIPRNRLTASRGQLPPSWAVIEIRGGRAVELGLRQGDQISFTSN
jgi:hypothetical protein